MLLPPIDSIVPGPVPLCGQEQVCRAGAQGQSSSKVPVAAPAPFLRESAAAGLTLDMVVRTTLERNPALEVFRQQRGIAQAGVVIARTYPYNPIVSAQLLDVHGAASPVLNSFQYQPVANLQLEVRGQRHFRKQAAFAALKRTDWEIAFQEVSFAVGAVRTFDTLLYRQAKLGVTEEFVRLNQAAAEQVKRLVDGAVLKPADLLLTQAEVTDVQSQLGLGRTALAAAQRDLARAMGITDVAELRASGTMARPVPSTRSEDLLEAALEHRPDLFAQQAAVAEAEARVRLQIADRYGNPTLGPGYEFDPGRLSYVGGQISLPIPIFNRRQGEIQQLQAQAAQVRSKLKQTEVEIRQDVAAAVQRLAEAQAWVKNYQNDVLPPLQRLLETMERLFKQGEPGTDVLRVLDFRRKLIRAHDGYLDALWTYSQALAELAQAVGDPAVAMGVYQPPAQADER